MHCTACGADISESAKFCGHCGAAQQQDSRSTAADGGGTSPSRPDAAPARGPATGAPRSTNHRPNGAMTVMRASGNIWYEEEPEHSVVAGQRRPLLILSEQYANLSDTQKTLTTDDLLKRVEKRLDESSVPVVVRKVKTRWLNDREEQRDRIVAELKDHVHSDIKMIMGLDYLGRWARFTIHLGIEPEQVEKPPMPWHTYLLWGGVAILVLGVLINQSAIAGLGFVAAVVGFVASKVVGKARGLKDMLKQQENRAKYSRTFKTDDFRLFESAMRHVFQQVVDDLVEQGGGTVRIVGGQGENFDRSRATADDEIQGSVMPVRASDAADLDV